MEPVVNAHFSLEPQRMGSIAQQTYVMMPKNWIRMADVSSAQNTQKGIRRLSANLTHVTPDKGF